MRALVVFGWTMTFILIVRSMMLELDAEQASVGVSRVMERHSGASKSNGDMHPSHGNSDDHRDPMSAASCAEHTVDSLERSILMNAECWLRPPCASETHY